MIYNPAGPINVAVHFMKHIEQDFFLNRLISINLADKKTAGGFDNRKGLVEFMGNAGGHFSQGCHFTGLDQLLFGFKSFGNITGGDQKHFFTRILGG